MKEFIERTQHYVPHVHVARWQDTHFRICRDTFLVHTMLSVIDFAKKYMIQLQNEIQIQYYHLEQVNIMVHITYTHGPDSNEQNIVILKEYHFFIRMIDIMT
jgi:hypothetical protein